MVAGGGLRAGDVALFLFGDLLTSLCGRLIFRSPQRPAIHTVTIEQTRARHGGAINRDH